MDLINGLSQAMGIDESQAQAVAGALMANVQGQAADNDPQTAEQVATAVPEMGGWLDAAKNMLGQQEEEPKEEQGMLGGLMGMASGGIGNQLLGAVAGKEAQNAAMLAGVLNKVGLDQSKATMAAPVLLNFLESRLDKQWMDKLMSVAPLLSGSAPAAASGGGMMGALGGLLGK